ncbi:cytidine deaminase [Psychromicrobium silvestre]|uniref:Cytidine deaminase n=1 Tax=Psychromicrobium silvestre TaxID=1645614 RepID=A0A7Y9S6J9_9MICC|nr:hypothetical protein [Psychromicrobium silvestre]NYE95479.1 cytidine deaminase [Psychromicrobium silvestre]
MLFPAEANLVEAALNLAATLPENDEHTVAAAAMDANGEIYTGVNVYHFSGGPCAELVVLGIAAAQGSAPLVSIVAAGHDGRGILAPCGRCRQTLIDYFPDIAVIMPSWPGEEGPTSIRISRLLPGTYRRPGRSSRPRVVYFSARYFDDVRLGRKTSTVRWNDPVELGPATLVFEFAETPRSIPGEVLGIRAVQMATLMAEADTAHGPGAGDQYLTALRQHYPDLNPEDQLEEVSFATRLDQI